MDLLEIVKASLFAPVARLLYGHVFVSAHGSAALQKAFYAFEETFELAASPVPHVLQRRFCRTRRFLLTAFRWDWRVDVEARSDPGMFSVSSLQVAPGEAAASTHLHIFTCMQTLIYLPHASCRQSVAAGHFDGTIVGELMAECDIGAGEAPHVLLAVLWASMVTAPGGLCVLVTTANHTPFMPTSVDMTIVST